MIPRGAHNALLCYTWEIWEKWEKKFIYTNHLKVAVIRLGIH